MREHRMTWQARPLAAGSVAALMLAAAACGGGSGSQSNSPSGASLDGLSAQQLYHQAKKEGLVTWYTSFLPQDIKVMAAQFAKKYPGIKITSLRLNAQKLPARVITEQRGGKYNADLLTGGATYINQLRQAGSLAPYSPPDAQPADDTGFPKGYQGVTYLQSTVIAYNPTALASRGLTPPKSWQDLTKPAWKGNFSIDPEAVNFYESLKKSRGEAGAKALVKALGDNSPRLTLNHTLEVTQVQAGEPIATATAYSHKVRQLHEKAPARVKIVMPNPVPTDFNLTVLAAKAPHGAAARLFEDWLLSRDGQQAILKQTGKISYRNDVDNDPAIWNPAKWKPAFPAASVSPDEYNADTKTYVALLHAS